MNALAHAWTDYVAAMLWQSTLVMLVVWTLFALLRRRSPALRHALLCLILVKFLLPVDFELFTGVGYWIGRLGGLAPGSTASMTMDQVTVTDPAAGATSDSRLPERAAVLAPPGIRAVSPATPTDKPSASGDRADVLFGVWLSVVAGLLLLLIVHARRLRRLLAGAREVRDADLLDMLEDCRRSMGIRRPVVLLDLPGLPSPLLCGLLRPRIVVCAAQLRRMDPARRRPLLLHELAHLARRDLWINAVQIVLQTAWFFHPGLWLTNWLIRREREKTCDDLVLARLDGGGTHYAAGMIEILKHANRPLLPALGMLGIREGRSAMKIRLTRILDEQRTITARLGRAGVLALLALAAVVLPLAYSGQIAERDLFPNEAGWSWAATPAEIVPLTSGAVPVIGYGIGNVAISARLDKAGSLAVTLAGDGSTPTRFDRENPQARLVAIDIRGRRYLLDVATHYEAGNTSLLVFNSPPNAAADQIVYMGLEIKAPAADDTTRSRYAAAQEDMRTIDMAQRAAKAMSDMRGLALAMEKYYIDNVAFPAWTDDPAHSIHAALAEQHPDGNWRLPAFRIKRDAGDRLMTLTTPVSYITRFPADPFADADGRTYQYYAPSLPVDPNRPPIGARTSIARQGKGWILWSPGPDGIYDIDAALDYDPRVPISPSLFEKTYDPTNGAVSAGDVWRSQAGTPDQIVYLGLEMKVPVIEQSTRSRVARALSDMRSLAMALDAYYVDNVAFPAWTDDIAQSIHATLAEQNPNDHWKLPSFRMIRDASDRLLTLTTPVSYITKYPPDPFAAVEGRTFQYYAPGLPVAPNQPGVLPPTMESLKYAGKGWILWSPGPDGVYDIDAAKDYDPRVSIPPALIDKTYDPTNGILSHGDLWRSQGYPSPSNSSPQPDRSNLRRELRTEELQQIARTMRRDEVYRLVGQPHDRNFVGGGLREVQIWWARDAAGGWSKLSLNFAADGRITNYEYQAGLPVDIRTRL
jgi:beta-lactamase regulating signal transducer with metallopeptidase domain